MSKHANILAAAPNLAGMALVIIAGLNVTDRARQTIADEIAWGATVVLLVSCFVAYLALRRDPLGERLDTLADLSFLFGLALLFVSVLSLALHY